METIEALKLQADFDFKASLENDSTSYACALQKWTSRGSLWSIESHWRDPEARKFVSIQIVAESSREVAISTKKKGGQ